ncbi:uncharacterized protein PG998_004525 [Apiospora kogelbergensis]|uniref:uncharacterized protein n=1 Tax=Apiospora kogelbergensis TaxID=1337665 RepID=UPI00313087DD
MKNIKMLVASLAMNLTGVSAVVLDNRSVPGFIGYVEHLEVPTSTVVSEPPVMGGHPQGKPDEHPVGNIKPLQEKAIVTTIMVTVTTSGPVTLLDPAGSTTTILGTYAAESAVVTTLTPDVSSSDTTVGVTVTVTTDSVTAAEDYSSTGSSSSTDATSTSSTASETSASSASTQSSVSSSSSASNIATSSTAVSSSTASAASATTSSSSSGDTSANEATSTPSASDDGSSTPDATQSASPTESSSSGASSNCVFMNALHTAMIFYAMFHLWDMACFDRVF